MMLWVIVFRWHGSIVIRVTNLDVRNAKRWVRGFGTQWFKNGAVKV